MLHFRLTEPHDTLSTIIDFRCERYGRPAKFRHKHKLGAFLLNMKQFFLTTALLLQILSVGCTQNRKPDVARPVNENVDLSYTQNKKLEIPENWKKIEECGFSFYAPLDLKEIQIHPVDSCAKQYRSRDIIFSIDLMEGYGDDFSSRSGEYSDNKDFQITRTTIDEQKAEIITYQLNDNGGFKERQDLFYGAVLYVPLIVKSGDNLTIWTYSRTTKDRETTEQMFETVRFEK